MIILLKYNRKLAEAKAKHQYKRRLKEMKKPSPGAGIRLPFSNIEVGIKLPKNSKLR